MRLGKHLHQQCGFVASYVLYGIGLLAIAGAAYGKLNANNRQAQQVQDTVEEVSAQLEVLKGKIMLCGAIYPDGDHAQFNTRHPYPAPATAGNQAAASVVECPGAPPGSRLLGNMPDGVPVPVSPPDFSPWIYEHTQANGVRLRLDPRVDGGAAAVRTRLLRRFQGSAVAVGDEVVFTILQ